MLETKIALLRYFWAAIWKNLFMSEINTLEFVKSQSFIQNKEIWNQKYLSRVVLGQNLKKDYCRIWNQHLQICQNAMFHVKWKKIKFGTKISLFGFFWTGNWKKTLAIFEISTLEFIKTEFLTIIVNFGLGSTFLALVSPFLLKVRVRACFITYAQRERESDQRDASNECY